MPQQGKVKMRYADTSLIYLCMVCANYFTQTLHQGQLADGRLQFRYDAENAAFIAAFTLSGIVMVLSALQLPVTSTSSKSRPSARLVKSSKSAVK
jgi:hypothetical protein